MAWHYLSFVDGRLPKGEQWLGAAIVEGLDITEAVKKAWRLGINPGGEVAGIEIEHVPSPRFCNRLMISKSELRDLGEAISGNDILHNSRGDIIKPDGVEDDP